jgi:hypothetical protein
VPSAPIPMFPSQARKTPFLPPIGLLSRSRPETPIFGYERSIDQLETHLAEIFAIGEGEKKAPGSRSCLTLSGRFLKKIDYAAFVVIFSFFETTTRPSIPKARSANELGSGTLVL